MSGLRPVISIAASKWIDSKISIDCWVQLSQKMSAYSKNGRTNVVDIERMIFVPDVCFYLAENIEYAVS